MSGGTEEAEDTPGPLGLSEPRAVAGGLVLIGILSVQLGSALATTLFDELGPGGAVFLRTIFAAAVLIAIWRPARAALAGETLRLVLLFGFVLASMNLCFFVALDRLPLGIAVTLEFVGPLTVAVAGSRKRSDLAFAALAAGGILLLAPSLGSGELDAVGVVFALLAGTFWGCYILLSARVGRGPTGRGGLSVAMVFGSVLLLPLGVASGGADLIDPHLLLAGFGVAMLSSAIPYTTELEALRRLPAKTVGVLLSLEPAAAALIGLIALDQDLPGREVVAIALVVAASFGALRGAEPVAIPEA
jgi:inner membrane transporter RhtA